MKAHFEMFAAYNTWANKRLYAAAGALDARDYRRDLGAFFGSVHGTLNHLLVGDLVWMARFEGRPNPDVGLDQAPHDRLDALWTARQALDQRIIDHISALSETALAQSFAYSMITRPRQTTERRDRALAHFFNHQTHHRGQTHALLTRLGADAPALDLIYYLQENS